MSQLATSRVAYGEERTDPVVEDAYRDRFLMRCPCVAHLYKIETGKEVHWAIDDAEKDRLLARQNGHASKAQVQRFKGLGEMNPSTLKETTLDPQTRTLLRITIEDTEKTEASIQTLMGKDVQPRFEFIMSRAPKVVELDV
jgi:DNA gyrase/topoisomerase IV subunit B